MDDLPVQLVLEIPVSGQPTSTTLYTQKVLSLIGQNIGTDAGYYEIRMKKFVLWLKKCSYHYRDWVGKKLMIQYSFTTINYLRIDKEFLYP